MKRTLAICSISLALLAAPGCDKHPTRPTSPPLPPPNPPTIGLQVTGPDRIAPGTTAQLTAKAMKAHGSIEDVTARVTWGSDYPEILAVSSDGRASARSVGTAVVMASLQNVNGPDLAQHPVLVVPANTFALSGIVRQTTYPVAGAKVEVVSGGAGTGMRVFTDAQGHFDLFGVAGAVKLRVGKDDYHATFHTFDVSRDRSVAVELEPSGELTALRGAYLVTFSMAACVYGELPKDLLTRTYRAQLSTDRDRADVRLFGKTFVVTGGRGDHFSIGLLPGQFAFSLGSNSYYFLNGYDIVEEIDSNHALAIYGSGQASGTPERITGVLEGGFVLAPGNGATTSGEVCAGPVAVSLVRQ